MRALKQNASAVVARVAAGEVVTVTDRGRPVAKLIPLPSSRLEELVVAGRARLPRRSLRDLPAPRRRHGKASLSEALEEMRRAERY